jgi:hypothetical protein
MEERKFYHGFLEYISKSIPSTMSFLASLIFILIMTAPTIQTVDVDVDGLLIVDIDTDERWITITVLEFSGNLTIQLVRAGNHLTPHLVEEGYKREMLVRYEEGVTTPYLVLNGTGWVHFVIEGYSQRVNIVFW